jgi:tetratricopeptide (TPR) repeat protein
MSFDARERYVIGLLLVALASAAAPPAAHAANAPPAVGTSVVIRGGATIKVGEKVVDTGKSHRVYKVDRVNGEWLWLVSGQVAGWARAVDVIAFDKAIDLYTDEIKRNPHTAWPYYNRGLIYQDLRDLDKAMTDYSAALRQDKNYVPALINRGNIWLAKRAYDRAIADYTEAIRLDAKDALAYLNRAIAVQAKGDFARAAKDYDEAIHLGVHTPSAYNNRGHAREMLKDYDGAIADYSEAIRLNPSYSLAWINRGSARQAKGEYAKALSDVAEASRLVPKSPWGYSRQAWILATCPEAKYRDGKAAVELASKACELAGANDARFLDVRAAAFAEAGDFSKAVYWESRAIDAAAKTASNDATNYRSRLKLYQDQKPYREPLPGRAATTASRSSSLGRSGPMP